MLKRYFSIAKQINEIELSKQYKGVSMLDKNLFKNAFFIDNEIKVMEDEISKLCEIERLNSKYLSKDLKDLKNKYISSLKKLIAIKNEILQEIDSIEDGQSRVIFKLRYLSCKSWEEIAEELDYSVMQLHRIHKKVLGG